MANYWPGLGYITPRRTITTIIRSTRRPSTPTPPSSTATSSMRPLGYILPRTAIPSTTPRPSTPTPPSSTATSSLRPLGYILPRTAIPSTSTSTSSTPRGGKSTCACSVYTNHQGSYVKNNGNKQLNTKATTSSTSGKKEAQGGHLHTSDRLHLPRKVLLNSLLHMGPEDAHLARQHSSTSSHRRPHIHTTSGRGTGGAALQPRPSRLSIMASAH